MVRRLVGAHSRNGDHFAISRTVRRRNGWKVFSHAQIQTFCFAREVVKHADLQDGFEIEAWLRN